MPDPKPGDTIAPESNSDRPNQDASQQQQPESQWQFKPEETPDAMPQAETAPYDEAVSWTASEFIAHEKSPGWYLLLGVASICLAGLIYLLTKDKIATGMVLFVAVIFAFAASRKPRVLTYQIGSDGVVVGEKLYNYQVLKSFAIAQDGAVNSIVLLPMRRFMPSVSLYYPPDQEEEILNALGAYLPQEERGLDPVDRFMRKIRF